MFLFQKLIYIFIIKRKKIIKIYHNTQKTGHWGVEGIIKKILKNYWFPKMRKIVKQYIQNYNLYNKNKIERYKFYKKIKVLEKFTRVWKFIIID